MCFLMIYQIAIKKWLSNEEGLTDKRKSEKQFFNQEGQLIEFKDWTKEGKIKEWIKYTYNSEGQLLTETALSAKGKVELKKVTEYQNGLKVKKSYYDAKERLVKEKFYDYEYFK
jgi:hypothetical protein